MTSEACYHWKTDVHVQGRGSQELHNLAWHCTMQVISSRLEVMKQHVFVPIGK